MDAAPKTPDEARETGRGVLMQRMVRRHALADAWELGRTSRNWSLRDAAKASGVSPSQILRFERGMDIKLSTLEKLLTAVCLKLVGTYRPARVTYSTDTVPPNAKPSDLRE